MSGMKTAAMLVALVFGAAKSGQASEGLLETFSDCVGRMSAQMEHQWLMQDPKSEATAETRLALLDILETVVTDRDVGRLVLARRLDAKQAHARLLQRATFSSDADNAIWAERQARSLVSQCESLVLRAPRESDVDAVDATDVVLR